MILVDFFFVTKNTLCCHSRCLSDRPSSIEINLKRGNTISTKPIAFKLGLNSDIGVMHAWKKFGFKIRIATQMFFYYVDGTPRIY